MITNKTIDYNDCKSYTLAAITSIMIMQEQGIGMEERK